jgi:HSP20 family protein
MIVRQRSITPSMSTAFDLDRTFEQLTSSFFDQRRPAGPVVDGTWSGDEYVLRVDLPGVPARAVDVSVTGTTLKIDVDHEGFTWQRTLRLGAALSADKVSAHHVDGRLTVRIGKHDEPEARSIEISTAAPAIEATSSVETADETADQTADQTADTA